MSATHSEGTQWRETARNQWRDDFAAAWQLLRRCSWMVLLVPGLTALMVLVSVYSSWHSLMRKGFQELAAPATLAFATLLAGAALVRRTGGATGLLRRHPFLMWQVVLVISLFCRELHFRGTNNGIYVVLIVLLWCLARHHKRMQPFVHSRMVISLLFGALWAYGVAKTFDRGYWRAWFPAVEPLRDAFEESIETTGHLLILFMVILSWRLATRDREQQERHEPSETDSSTTGSTTGCTTTNPDAVPDSATRRRVFSGRLVACGLLTLLGGGLLAAWALPRQVETQDPVREAGALPFELSSLCRATLPSGEEYFLAGSDEFRTLALCRLDADGRPQFLHDLTLQIPLPEGGPLQLDDLEGLATDGNGTCYAVTSHRQLEAVKDRRRQRRSQTTECALVAFRLSSAEGRVRVVAPRMVCADLLQKIRALHLFPSVNWQNDKTFRWRRWAKSWQIDLEGLAVCDGRLLLGFKNPVEEGRAAILALDVHTGRLTVLARPDFQKQGILSLCYDAERDRLLILTNDPLKGHRGNSCLWIATRSRPGSPWQFPQEPNMVLEDGGNTGRKASGLTVMGERMLVCFDDPQRPVLRVFPLP